MPYGKAMDVAKQSQKIEGIPKSRLDL